MDGEIKGYVYKNYLDEKSILRRAFVQGGKIDIFARWFQMKKNLSYTNLPIFSILRQNKMTLKYRTVHIPLNILGILVRNIYKRNLIRENAPSDRIPIYVALMNTIYNAFCG